MEISQREVAVSDVERDDVVHEFPVAKVEDLGYIGGKIVKGGVSGCEYREWACKTEEFD